jgi:hypothetical protein
VIEKIPRIGRRCRDFAKMKLHGAPVWRVLESGARKNVKEEIKTAVCPQPIRTREDDKIVEIFLHVYQDGRFAHKLE